MKKSISLLTLFALLLSCITMGGMSVSAAEHKFSYKKLSDTTAEITGYSGDGGNFTIPAEIDGLKIVSIGNQAFYQAKNLDHITLPDTITSIGYKAFAGSHIKGITMADSVTSMGNCAFKDCIYLADVKLSSGLDKISNNAFYFCTRLESVVIPEGVSVIEPSAFQLCTHLTDVTLPSSIRTIDEHAFAEAPFTKIVLPEGLKDINDEAFIKCESLTTITLPSTLHRVGDFAFSLCTSLTELNICDGVEVIGNYTFDACPIKEVTIPESVKGIGLYTLGYTYDLFDCIKTEGFTIICKDGSAAYRYAVDNGFIVKDIDAEPIPSESTSSEIPTVPTSTSEITEIPTQSSSATNAGSSSTVTPPAPDKKLGDADGNGTVNVKDATAIQKVVAGLEVKNYSADVADADESGTVNVKDATAIQKWVAGILTNSNIGR